MKRLERNNKILIFASVLVAALVVYFLK